MRKKLLFVLLLITLGITGAWAEELSEKEAQQLAQSFANSHFGRKGGGSELKSLGQVSGLYVFNMSDKGGFVIVSNESRTIPILGFSDSGTFDPDNMPENMRAWLQGYADEIAWLQKQKENNTVTVTKTRTRGGSIKADIAPLVTTKWDQGIPYNNQCPTLNGSKCATGCVATAMAQVMKYHEWPTAATTAIPGYTINGVTRPSLDAIIFGWGNMKNDYSGNYTSEEATAVATLMQYCGYSVEMDYGPESSAYTSDVAYALKTYFGYNNETTCVVSRSLYTSDKWRDIIYHELSERRPVLYAGQSTGGGHAFVCDGYKNEKSTDYFHINWGWGGQSDEYYVLSVLNPYAGQSTGGSSSNDGFHYGQLAVIGIQPSTGTGKIGDITPNIYNLTMNSMTLSHSSVTIGTEVTATLNITNNNAYDYEGDIYLGLKDGGDYYLLEGDFFSIPARQTKDCVIKFIPNQDITYDLCLYLPHSDTNYYGYYTTDGIIWASLPVVESGKGIPTNLSVTNITSTGATLSWVDEGTASAWKVGYKADDAESFTVVNATEKPFTLSDLSPETHYTVKVQKVINETSQSEWSPEFTFTTTAAYPAPENLTVSQVKPNSALVSWTGSANSYDIRYSVYNEGSEYAWSEPVVNTTNKSYTLLGLTFTNKYAVQVRSNYGYDNHSDWVTAIINMALELGNTDNNNGTLIEAWNGKTTNVTLKGRTLYMDGKWNTLCLPFDLGNANAEDGHHFDGTPLERAEIRTLTGASLSEGTLTLDFTDAVTSITAGTPYIIKWSKASGYDQADAQTRDLIDPVFTGVTIDKTMNNITPTGDNSDGTVTFKGTYNPIIFDQADEYILFMGENNTLYYPQSGAKINSCRAYFQLNDQTNAVRAINLNFGDEGEKTGITTTNFTNFTNSSDTWYDLSGRRLSGKPSAKGLYINNGRLEIIK